MIDQDTRAIMEDISKDAATKAVEEVLTRLGIDHADPIAVQKDLAHLREWREAMEAMKNKTLLTIVGVAVAGIIAILWLGIQTILSGAR